MKVVYSLAIVLLLMFFVPVVSAISWNVVPFEITYVSSSGSTEQSIALRESVVINDTTNTIGLSGVYRIESEIEFGTVPTVVVAQAALDLATLITQIKSLPSNGTLTTPIGSVGGQTITPGVWDISGATNAVLSIIFDAQGDPDAVFVIRVGPGPASTLSFGAANIQTLVNDAQSSNVYWIASGAVAASAGVKAKGTIIMESGGIAPGAPFEINGRLLAHGSISMTTANFSRPTGTISTTQPVVGGLYYPLLDQFVIYTTTLTIAHVGTGGTGDAGSGSGGAITLAGLDGKIWGLTEGLTDFKFELLNNGVSIPNTSRHFIIPVSSEGVHIALAGVTEVSTGEDISVKLTSTLGTATIKNRGVFGFMLN